jgi:glycosyltransferase involved in cell wall biosynthesis
VSNLPQRKVALVIYQIGSGADGGIQSVQEIARSVPDLLSVIVTNIESPFTDRLRQIAPVQIWPMVESSYRGSASTPLYRLAQVQARLRNNLRMWRMLRAGAPAVLHANEQPAFWNSALGAKLAGAPVIFNVRDTMPANSRQRSRWQRALKLCDRFLLLSQEMLQAWRRDLKPVSLEHPHADKLAYIYSIVDRTLYHPALPEEREAGRVDLGIDDHRPAIAYIGRFDAKKAQLPFIEQALPALKRLRPDAITYFVGDFEPEADPYAASCLAAVHRLDLVDQVRFAGYSANTRNWYRFADLVALASVREGLPRCMIESLASGAPFVTFDVCSTREILEGFDCGKVVAQGDYEALAGEMAGLLDDNALRALYRERGPKVAAELFDRNRNRELYRQLVASL